ncbi:hypothetical protein [Proteus terrae]|uniref:hypothetical protein n=1 Tax=Proteus terrae TaxID=1574161 RepID=UPI0021BBB067|nr:hypothetical protein [Proteus terrae]MCT8232791.1 hypothetical protein [Proteus terrae]MCW9687540.1 hypothetical protein [Proteus terrae]
MNKKYILILSFLFTSYASTHFYEEAKENRASINEYSQSNSNTSDPSGCVWSPCNDEWR